MLLTPRPSRLKLRPRAALGLEGTGPRAPRCDRRDRRRGQKTTVTSVTHGRRVGGRARWREASRRMMHFIPCTCRLLGCRGFKDSRLGSIAGEGKPQVRGQIGGVRRTCLSFLQSLNCVADPISKCSCSLFCWLAAPRLGTFLT